MPRLYPLRIVGMVGPAKSLQSFRASNQRERIGVYINRTKNTETTMIVFTNKNQWLFIPTIGLVWDDPNGILWLTVTFLNFGISFKVLTLSRGET